MRAENRAHVEKFFTSLHKVENLHPEILCDCERVWTVNETAVDANTGAATSFCSDSGHGEFAATSATNGPNKHIAAVVAVYGSGRNTPPFLL